MNRSSKDPNIWYVDNILPHENHLRSWLKGKFPNVADLDDVMQEAMFKVLRAHASGPIINPKAYLFLTARNIVISRFRSQKFVGPALAEDIDLAEIMEDEAADPYEQVSRKEEIDLLISAIKSLPRRSRQVLTLRKVYGYSLKETSKKLGMSVSAVGTQTAIGIEKCEAYLRKHHYRGLSK